ncbi:MAG TPA: S41 family peptidase [Thermoanaerobaculia bacterium]|nr:S41 family peptidase [Thermoanaerobaculia bacterium]
MRPGHSFLLVPLFALLAATLARAEPPRPLDRHGIENLTAFTRLLALIRFFHPSDAAALADWNRVAVAGVGAVEGAADSGALAETLQQYFHPLAPTVRVYPTGKRPALPAELLQPSTGGPFKVVAWRHYGGHFDGTSKVFHSDRIDDRTPPGFGTLVQAIAAGSLRGKRVHLRADVRTAVEPGGFARLGLRVDRAGGKAVFLDTMADRPIRDASWKTYEMEGEVPDDAERIVVLLVMTGGGKVWLDDVALQPVGAPGAALLANGDLETGELGRQPPGWYFPYESVSAGYHLLLRRGEPCRHGGCAELASDDLATPHIPRPDEVLDVDLGAGVSALLPVALWADSSPGGTVPHARAGEPPAPWTGTDPEPDTRAARLATVALVWGIQQHLNPELDPADPDWIAALPAALDGAARAEDREAFRRVLSRMLLPLHDVRTAGVVQHDSPDEKTLPLTWAWVEDRLVVTGVIGPAGAGAAALRPGDIVSTLDGRPAAAALAEIEAITPGASAATRRALALEFLTAGPAGSRVTLGIERAGQPAGTVILAHDTDDQVPDTPLPPFAEVKPGVFYLDLRRTSDDEFKKLIPRLAKARGLVLDLRGRPDVSTVILSHLAAKTVRSASWQVPVVMQPDHRDMKWLTTFWSIEPKEPRFRARTAFLTDARATGFAETLLTMVESDHLGQIVGETSGGDDGNPTWANLPGGWTVRWSAGRTLKQDGTPLHGVGVPPTVPAVRTLAGIAAGRSDSAVASRRPAESE